jgi:hypothetical protein
MNADPQSLNIRRLRRFRFEAYQRGRRLGLGAVLPHSATPTPLFEHEDDFDAPGERHQRRGREVQFGQGAILRYSSTPTLRSQGIEDEDEAPGEVLRNPQILKPAQPSVRSHTRSPDSLRVSKPISRNLRNLCNLRIQFRFSG